MQFAGVYAPAIMQLFHGLKRRSTACGCAGFLQQFAAVVDESRPGMHLGKVLAELSGGRKPNRVLCTGHSLGGALATLGACSAGDSESSLIDRFEFCSPLRPHNLLLLHHQEFFCHHTLCRAWTE